MLMLALFLCSAILSERKTTQVHNITECAGVGRRVNRDTLEPAHTKMTNFHFLAFSESLSTQHSHSESKPEQTRQALIFSHCTLRLVAPRNTARAHP